MKSSTKYAEYQQIHEELDKVSKRCEYIEARIVSLYENLKEDARKQDVKEKDPPDSFSPILSFMKDEIVLVGFLILYVGLLSTEAYYANFGVKYQFLKLPSYHIIYRGLTVLIDAPYLLIPYFMTISLLRLDFYAVRYKWIRYLHFRNVGIYLALLLMLVITYPLAVKAGAKQALLDLQEGTTSLPQITKMVTNKEELRYPAVNYRLLMADSDYIIIFKPLEQEDHSTIPHIKRYLKGDVYVLETNP